MPICISTYVFSERVQILIKYFNQVRLRLDLGQCCNYYAYSVHIVSLLNLSLVNTFLNDWVIIMAHCVPLLAMLHLFPRDRIVEGSAWFLSPRSLFIPCYFKFHFILLKLLFV